MLAWLENDLATTRATWRIPFFHHLPYPIEHHVGDPLCIAAQQQLVPIFERYGVQLVFSGHEHTYQRSKPMRGGAPVTSGTGIVYMVSGGGGGGLHPVVPKDFLVKAESVHHYLRVEADASKITIHAIGTDGKEFDTLQPGAASAGCGHSRRECSVVGARRRSRRADFDFREPASRRTRARLPDHRCP